jgi:hypothetical protein
VKRTWPKCEAKIADGVGHLERSRGTEARSAMKRVNFRTMIVDATAATNQPLSGTREPL